MIQVLGLREYVGDDGELHKAERFFEKKWRFKSVQEAFVNAKAFTASLDKDYLWNLYYTTSHCKEESGRVFMYQDVIPFDLDVVDYTKLDKYIKIVSDILKVPASDMGILASGNGLQFIVGLTSPITDPAYFSSHKIFYNSICAEIFTQCLIEQLAIKEVDTSVFKTTQLMRLPYTVNRKEKFGDKPTRLINATINPVNFDLVEISGMPLVEAQEQCSAEVMRNFPKPDTTAVLEGCDFIRWAKENQNEVSEPQWFALLSVIGRLDHAKDLAHEYSAQYTGYNAKRTDRKLEHAIKASNPRTCDNIQSLWGKCSDCKFFGKRKSPITITSVTTVKNRHMGFYYPVPTAVPGEFKKGKPHYDALMQEFINAHTFVTNRSSGLISAYRGTHWEDVSHYEISAFCETHFDPKPTSSLCSEFLGKLQRNNLVDTNFFVTSGATNLANGVLKYTTGAFGGHSPKYGFKYTLPYYYDQDATCPVFDRFVHSVMGGDKNKIAMLLEFLGATLANAPSEKVQKALVLTGKGSNGKSTFIDLLRALVGDKNVSTLMMGKELEKMEHRYMLDGKLCNISEESPTGSLRDSSLFKAIVTGGSIAARKLYTDSYNLQVNAKVILLCNEIPASTDSSYGFKRRLLIVDFSQKFSHEAGNIDVDMREQLFTELSGIFNKALTAYHRLVKNKYMFTGHAEAVKRVEEYLEENQSPVNTFFDAYVVKDENGVFQSSDLYQEYKLWCMENNITGKDFLNAVWFGRAVRDNFPSTEPTRIKAKRGSMTHGYRIVKQTEEEEQVSGF